MTRRRVWAVALVCAAAGLLAVSWFRGGLVYVLVVATLDGQAGIDLIRDYVLSFGPLAPAVYVVATAVEVIVAPIPGILLYAPGGAIFGGWWGGTLSLAGNGIGAFIATLIGRVLGEPWVASRFEQGKLDRLRERILRRALWVIILLRANPLTSTDIVSYAAGAFGIPPWKVAVGTLIGMAPLCYLQAHGAEWIFASLPSSGAIVVGLGFAYFVVVIWLIAKKRES